MARKAYNTVSDIRCAHINFGGHFFDRDSMRYFNSRILDGVIGGRYFITSEKYREEPRRYTIREITYPDRDIVTRGEFQGYRTAAAARKDATAFAALDAEHGID